MADGRRKRVLIVDDEASVLLALQMAFEEVDWHIEVSTSAELALAKHRAEPFDLIITDKNLPDMDGVHLIREIRASDPFTRIMLITGFPNLASAVETANLGIDAYIEKPFKNVFHVLDRATELLQRSELLPAAQLTRNSRGNAADATPSTRAGQGPASEAPLRKDTVLLACATTKIGMQMQDTLRSQELEVVSAKSVAELFEKLASWRPALLMIHEASNVIELVSRVRKAAPGVSVAVISNGLDVGTTIRLIELKIAAIITSEPDSPDFDARLRSLAQAVKRAS